MITTNDEKLAKKIKLLRTHGITKEHLNKSKSKNPWYYEMVELGFNYRLTDIQKWDLQAGDVFVDAGANLGFVSILAAMAWPSAHVYGFEANPLTHAFLAENVWRNGVKNRVQANNLGLSGDGRDLHAPHPSQVPTGA